MESLPHVTFYAYTKMVPLLEGEKLPENFTVIYSYGGIFDDKIDKTKHRHASIFKDKIEAGYANASENDLNAIKKNFKIGLLSH